MRPLIDDDTLVERKIGEKIECMFNGELKTVVAYPAPADSMNCEGCVFKPASTIKCLPFYNLIGACERYGRSDKKDIIFKEIVPNQFEMMRTMICRLSLEWLKAHPTQTKFHYAVYMVTRELFPLESAIIRNSEASILKNKENLTPFWEKLKELINKKMNPITIKDFIEYLQTFPEDYELHCFNDGEPIRASNSETVHDKKIVVLHFE